MQKQIKEAKQEGKQTNNKKKTNMHTNKPNIKQTLLLLIS